MLCNDLDEVLNNELDEFKNQIFIGNLNDDDYCNYEYESDIECDIKRDTESNIENDTESDTEKNKKKCISVVANCLIKGNSFDLSLCLDELANKDMFILAHEELKIRPSVALKILETFRIGNVYEKGLKVPMCFENWKNNVLSKMNNIKDVILENENLMTYLKGVIQFVRNNPGLLNKNYNEKTNNVKYVINEYDQAIGMKWNTNINSTGKQINAYIDSIYGYAPIPMDLPLLQSKVTNAYVGLNPIFMNPFNQMGGNLNKINSNELSSTLLLKLMNRVQSDLKEAGIELNQKDKKILEKSLNEVKNIETKTFQLYKLLKKLSELFKFFKESSCETDMNISYNIKLSKLTKKKCSNNGYNRRKC